MNVFKINFEIFKKRFKINTTFKLIEFFTIIFFIISLIHIVFIFLGKYEDMYLIKSLFFLTIIVEFIFPKYNLNNKLKLKSFFGKLKSEEIERYYTSKNLIRALILCFFVFIPYNLELINLSLFYITIMSFLFLIVIFFRKKFLKINFQTFLLSIRAFFIIFFLIFIKNGDGKILKNFANKISFVIYFLLIFIFICISIKILNSMKSNYIKKHTFSKFLINSEKYFGYNFLYIVRSGNFIKNISLFYTISILTIYRESIENAVVSFTISLVLNGIVNLFYIFKIEHNRFNFIYDKNYLKKINKLKISDSIKLHLISVIFTIPVIYFKVGIVLSLKIIFISTVITILLNIFVTKMIYKKRYKYDKKDIVLITVINIILSIIGINFLV